MFCITPQLACRQGKRTAVTRKTTVYTPDHIHPPQMYEVAVIVVMLASVFVIGI
jgi:hypothetical protein